MRGTQRAFREEKSQLGGDEWGFRVAVSLGVPASAEELHRFAMSGIRHLRSLSSLSTHMKPRFIGTFKTPSVIDSAPMNGPEVSPRVTHAKEKRNMKAEESAAAMQKHRVSGNP